MPSAQKIKRSTAQVNAVNETATVVKQTLADAIAACLAGEVAVGNDVEWREREPDTGIGGSWGKLLDAGSAANRADPDNGSVIWVGDDGLYIYRPTKIATLEDFGAESLSQEKFEAISANIFYMKCDTEIHLSEQIVINSDSLTIDLRKFKVTSALTSGEAIIIAGNNNNFLINFDGQNQAVTPVRITGAGNDVKGLIRNVQAKSGMANTHISCIDDRAGQKTSIQVKCYDITNDGYSLNGSFPHCVSLQNGSTDAQVRLIGENVISGVIASDCKTPVIHECIITGAADNGVYILEDAVGAVIKYLRYKGSEEPFVDKGLDTKLECADVIDIKAPFGFHNSRNCTIKEVNLIYDDLDSVKAIRSAIFQTRDGNTLTTDLKIGKVNGRTYGNRIFGFDNGECKNWTIKNCEITHIYHNSSQSKAIFSQAGLNTGFYHVINCDFRIVDETETLTSSDVFTFAMPIGITKLSKWHNNELDCDGPFKAYVNNVGIENVSIRGAVMETSFGPRLRENGYTNFGRKDVKATAIPTRGYWEKGDRVNLVNTSLGGTKDACCTESGDFSGTPPQFESR